MHTETVNVRDPACTNSAIQQAAEILAAGGLVAFPTETVYGLAARADLPEALAQLSRLKNRPANKPFTLHLADKSQLARYVGPLAPVDRVLLRRAWPGPLTVVFVIPSEQQSCLPQGLSEQTAAAMYYKGSIGIRLPDHDVARRLLAAAAGPVVAPSANLAGSGPARCAQEVIEELDGRIELVLDAGPARYSRPSTVARLDGTGIEILRPGVLDEAALARMRRLTILFVCTGNTCRSPIAQGFCRDRLARKLSCSVDQLLEKGYKVVSAGVMAYSGASASPEAVRVCRDAGQDITAHRARPLTAQVISEADYIFVMTDAHRQAVMALLSEAEPRTALLGGAVEIADPMGGSLDDYRRCAEQIELGLTERLSEIFAESPGC